MALDEASEFAGFDENDEKDFDELEGDYFDDDLDEIELNDEEEDEDSWRFRIDDKLEEEDDHDDHQYEEFNHLDLRKDLDDY